MRGRIVAAASELLATGGPDAVTTRAVATAAGVQAPTIYRLFGDKDGLLESVADTVFAEYVDAKQVGHETDPIRELQDSFLAHIRFGTRNPGLTAFFADPLRPRSATEEKGIAVLRQRVHRVALAGRLRIPEERAVALIRAIGNGTVLALIESPEPERDSPLVENSWEALAAILLTDAADRADQQTRAAALRLRADDTALAALSPAERMLMREWLDRIAGA